MTSGISIKRPRALLAACVLAGLQLTLGGCKEPAPAECQAATAHRDGEVLASQPANAPQACGKKTGFISYGNAQLIINKVGDFLFTPAPINKVARSLDQGATWKLLDQTMGNGGLPIGLHPWLWQDKDSGRVFFNIYRGGEPGCKLLQGGTATFFSDDYGTTWTQQTVGCGTQDYGKIFSGPAATAESQAILDANGYPNVVYMCAEGPIVLLGFNRVCFKSLDGGKTYTETRSSAIALENAQHGWPGAGAVDQDGTIYVASTSTYIAGNLGVRVNISHDEGETWESEYIPGSDFNLYDYIHVLPDHYNFLSVNVTTDKEGNVYVVWVDDTDFQPYVAASKDKGKTWTAPIKFGMKQFSAAVNPNIAVKEPGYVAIAYFATEDDRNPIDFIGLGGYFVPDDREYDAYLSVTRNLFADAPTIWTARYNDPEKPSIIGMWFAQGEYLGQPQFAPDGTIWTGFNNQNWGLAARMTAPPK